MLFSLGVLVCYNYHGKFSLAHCIVQSCQMCLGSHGHATTHTADGSNHMATSEADVACPCPPECTSLGLQGDPNDYKVNDYQGKH